MAVALDCISRPGAALQCAETGLSYLNSSDPIDAFLRAYYVSYPASYQAKLDKHKQAVPHLLVLWLLAVREFLVVIDVELIAITVVDIAAVVVCIVVITSVASDVQAAPEDAETSKGPAGLNPLAASFPWLTLN
ncbi:hypothetical protein CONLIGDRAFT_687728 [Coniochaeta ligniaria NRRL 30616]|uniref:Uncharacterized protein n=1 Tax=Coniochaeta ligniaria NRRL 30616 TaxID=1408157 RepID=A0A1J7IZE4_9PEZI|nr:hypothetical protein CONLIGDRAFT_687728 [Coniochaeta ligniaria NRRL 30616]